MVPDLRARHKARVPDLSPREGSAIHTTRSFLPLGFSREPNIPAQLTGAPRTVGVGVIKADPHHRRVNVPPSALREHPISMLGAPEWGAVSSSSRLVSVRELMRVLRDRVEELEVLSTGHRELADEKV